MDSKGNLVDRMRQVLSQSFPGGTVQIEEDSEHRVYGEIVADDFVGESDRMRQQRVWGILARQFKPEDLVEVSIILTSTRDEHEMIGEYPPNQD